jgi:hypothetical protein
LFPVLPCDEPGGGKPAADMLADGRATEDGGAESVLSGPGCEGRAGRAQKLYCELAQTVCDRLRKSAEAGDEDAGRWLEQFLALGEQLGVHLTPRQASAAADLADAILRDAIESRRAPSATYRLQYNRNFTFRDATRWRP